MSALLTKEDIARELNPDEPLSIRSVERYIQLAGVRPAVLGKGRGKQSQFARADVDKIVAAYHKAQAEQQQARDTQALATTKPASLERVAVVGELVAQQSEAFRALSSALDPWPVWMTKQQAVELSGVPSSYFDLGVRAGELPHVGAGTGRRYHRDDIRRFAAQMREPGFIEGLKKEKDATP
jgi:hypothetical protein